MTTKSSKKTNNALWLTDLHLDRATQAQKILFLDSLAGIEYDRVIVTGDISNAVNIRKHLLQIASACAPRPGHFVLGNHDYYGSGLGAVEAEIAGLRGMAKNLHHLDGRQIIPIGHGTCLMGHRGWADARAGYGSRTIIDSPDRSQISDFSAMGRNSMLKRMRELGSESAALIRKTLPLALTLYRHVVIITHVPPFADAVLYDSKPCAQTHLPHFVNLSAGLAIRSIIRAFPQRRVTVLCGHTHSAAKVRILPNLTAIVGGARTFMPEALQIIDLK